MGILTRVMKVAIGVGYACVGVAAVIIGGAMAKDGLVNSDSVDQLFRKAA